MRPRKAVFLDLFGLAGAVAASLVIGIIVIFCVSSEPLAAMNAFFVEPLTNAFNFGSILNRMVPLVFTGLAIAVVFQSGVFSMGAEGQLYIGALTGAVAAVYMKGLSAWMHIPLVLVCAILGGGLFAFLPGILKARFKADEIVSTLMFNYIGIFFVSYLLNNVIKDANSGGFARTPYVQDSARLHQIVQGFPTLYSFVFALAAAAVVYILLFKTRTGYELRLVGKNPLFAEYGGIHIRKAIVLSMVISGALAGLGGAMEVIGQQGALNDHFSTGLGFDGIIISLLARNHPIGILVSAFFYAYLTVGGQNMQAGSDVPRDLAVIIQSLLVLFVSSQALFAYLNSRKAVRKGGAEVAS
ncbi:ABC transporter permease [Paenibacillus beijingensis]|uniref:ABC transporter permease n=1 Tax=Paenibacillus beijingensis TaxID=1126833 RepID=A0A0D5NHJ9_9BACL|nr:ABC transporter permease [Paenibacillus beijingensis]AJY74393.1 hypothetical protein VN24_07155 [Paenibacillus beijingensis]